MVSEISAFLNTFVSYFSNMKKHFFTLGAFLFCITGYAQYDISLNAPQYDTGKVFLTYHLGKSLNIADSGFFNKGKVQFKGGNTLPGGIYAIVFPGKRLSSDFLIDKSKKISLTADDTLKIFKMKIIGEPANDLFEQYQTFISEKGPLVQKARQAFTSAKSAEDSSKYEAEFKKANQEIIDFRNNLIDKNPQSLMAALLLAMKEPPYPDKVPVTHQDSVDNYQYYKSHYWDGISFLDDRILRTPFFIPKLERYYRDVMPQASDSLIKDIDYKLLLARNAPELYKYLLNWLTDEYINPTYMGQDAVFVHLFNKYHSKGLTPWLNEKQMKTISDRAYMQMANLIGEQAAPLEMLDSTGKLTPLYNVKADYTIVIFWDPNCGHCKKELPRIDSIYQAEWKSKNLKIYAVLTENEHIKEWVNYIKEHHLGNWIHVYQTEAMAKEDEKLNRASYRQLYDVTQTPTIFLLDKNKRIIGKKLAFEQINDLLKIKWDKDNKE